MKIADTLLSLWEPAKPQSKPTAGGWEPQRPSYHALQQGSSGLAEQIELGLTNVVVSRRSEAFDRDHQRLDLERTHLEGARRNRGGARELN